MKNNELMEWLISQGFVKDEPLSPSEIRDIWLFLESDGCKIEVIGESDLSEDEKYIKEIVEEMVFEDGGAIFYSKAYKEGDIEVQDFYDIKFYNNFAPEKSAEDIVIK